LRIRLPTKVVGAGAGAAAFLGMVDSPSFVVSFSQGLRGDQFLVAQETGLLRALITPNAQYIMHLVV
jgi:hypothetical protein